MDLTQAEQDFFATGNLPSELQAEADAAAASIPAPKPQAEPAVSDPTPQIAPTPQTDAQQQALQAANERALRAEIRLQELERAAAEKAIPAENAPDEESDPLGAMMHQLKQTNSLVANLQSQLTQEQQNNLMKQQFEQFTQSVRAIKEQFEKSTPDFNDAYNHIRAIRTEDLRSVGISEADIPKVLLQDELNIAQTAVQRGKNPAEEMYNMAKRYGYAGKASPAKQQQTPDEKLANIVNGQRAAKQPTKAGADSELTFDGLKDAGNDDLNKLVQDDNLWHKLVGGTTKDIF